MLGKSSITAGQGTSFADQGKDRLCFTGLMILEKYDSMPVMDEKDREKYLLENRHSRIDDYSPIIRLGEKPPETKIGKFFYELNYKVSDFWRKINIAMRPRRQLTKKETIVFVSVLFLFVLVNAVVFSSGFFVKKEYPSFLAFGDIMFDRGVRNVVRKGVDPFENIKQNRSILQKYKLVMANLEGPIIETDRIYCQQKAYSFQFPTDTAVRIKEAGIHMVSIANNHSFDCFQKGVDSTENFLNKSGVSYIGEANLDRSFTIKTIAEKKVAFVGIDQTIMPVPLSKFYPLIKRLKLENDYVVVFMHWGTEYLLTADSRQTDIGHKLIDNGADIVFGSHPHVVEPVEVYKNRPIFYSLGNFVFDQDFGDTTVGLGAGVEIQTEKIKVSLYPFNLTKFKPTFMSSASASTFCSKFLDKVDAVGCDFEIPIKN